MTRAFVTVDENNNLPASVKGKLDTHYAPVWQPSTEYTAGKALLLPNGQTGTRTTTGTSRPSFDSTEQAAWTVASAGSGVSDAVGAGYDVVAILGQSNARGTNTDYDVTNIDVSDPRIFTFPSSGSSANTIIAAVEPLRGPEAPAGMGPGFPFAREYVASIPAQRKVLLVPLAVGSSGFEGSTSTPPARWKVGRVQSGETNLYEQAITQLTAALAAAGANSRVVAIIWHQGEADADVNVSQATYASDLDELIVGLRTRLPSLARVPFLVNQMAAGRMTSAPGGAAVNAAQIDTPRRQILTAWSPAPAMSLVAGDNTHFLAAGQRLIGHRNVEALGRALRNVKGIVPVPPSNVKKSVSGTTTTITWDAPVGRVTDYLIEYLDYGTGVWTAIAHAASIATTAAVTTTTAPPQVRVSSVNEAGTSEPAYSAATGSGAPGDTLLPTPTGVAAVSPSTSTMFVVANPVEGATSYQWEYRKASDSSVLTTTAAATPGATLTGLTPDTLYVVRPIAKATGAASAPGAFVQVRTSNAQSAITFGRVHSLRKVVSAYAGQAIKVRRALDNVEQDIPFAGNDLDVAALLSFAGAAGSLYVTTIYDQSGNGRNLTQATAAKQPLIVNAGEVQTMNARPSMVFDGTNDYLVNPTAGAYAAGSASFLGVLSAPNIQDTLGRVIVGEAWSGGSNTAYLVESYNAKLAQYFRDNTGTVLLARAAGTETPLLCTNAPVQFSFIDSGSNIARRINGATTLPDQPYTRSGMSSLPDRNMMGAYLRAASTESEFFSGRIAEVVQAFSALSTTDRDALEAAQKAYYGTA